LSTALSSVGLLIRGSQVQILPGSLAGTSGEESARRVEHSARRTDNTALTREASVAKLHEFVVQPTLVLVQAPGERRGRSVVMSLGFAIAAVEAELEAELEDEAG